MNNNNPFWNLPNLEEIDSQDGFLQRLQDTEALENVLYRPENLGNKGHRTIKIESKMFLRCSFSHTRVIGIIFHDCVFKECLLIGSTFEDCEFHRCDFELTNTYKISFVSTYIDPRNFRRCLDRKKYQNIGVHLFQELLNNSRSQDQVIFEREAMFQFLRWKRFQDWYEVRQDCEKLKDGFKPKRALLVRVIREYASCALRKAWECVSGSGLRILNFVVFATLSALVFSFFNHRFGEDFGLTANGSWDYWKALYFTIISLTTLGYGDITPTTSLGQMMAGLQSIFGFILFALLTSMLFRRLFP